MKLYNTLTRQITELKPQNPPEVKLYTCGPTVYDYMHIGNWFTFIRYDTLVRTLIAVGFKPTWVMNITDVGHLTSDADTGEDKLAAKAVREGKTAWEIADFYTKYFEQGLRRLNFIIPAVMPKATENIPEQINFIKSLETKGYTYQINDGIYYDTSKFSRYRDFANLELDEIQPGARIEHNPQKRNPSDFALWKFSPTDAKRDMEWDSPWGKGFPGWHIECSAMCLKYLGPTLDIHSGGIDHIPVHHTNEIAQSEALTEQSLAKFWVHTNHILINNIKISKSLGNTITLEDLADKGFAPETLRLLVLESHYRSQSRFSWDSLASAQTRLLRYKNFAVRRFQLTGSDRLAPPDLLSYLANDLNTPEALAELEAWFDLAESKTLQLESIENAISLIDQLLGLNLAGVKDISDATKALIAKRERARTQKNWVLADSMRKELQGAGILVLDTPSGPIWQYLD
jgi:cysteinyl-tRNA synthetase